MSSITLYQDSEGRQCLKGVLTFVSVPILERQAADLHAADGELVIDLGEVVRADSAGLALLVEWTRRAKQRSQPIRFLNVPEQLRAIAAVSGLDGILPLS